VPAKPRSPAGRAHANQFWVCLIWAHPQGGGGLHWLACAAAAAMRAAHICVCLGQELPPSSCGSLEHGSNLQRAPRFPSERDNNKLPGAWRGERRVLGPPQLPSCCRRQKRLVVSWAGTVLIEPEFCNQHRSIFIACWGRAVALAALPLGPMSLLGLLLNISTNAKSLGGPARHYITHKRTRRVPAHVWFGAGSPAARPTCAELFCRAVPYGSITVASNADRSVAKRVWDGAAAGLLRPFCDARPGAPHASLCLLEVWHCAAEALGLDHTPPRAACWSWGSLRGCVICHSYRASHTGTGPLAAP
jgi:hypothetical protein